MIRLLTCALVTLLIIISPVHQIPFAANDDPLEALARDLESDDEDVRVKAVSALGKIEDPQAVHLLIGAMAADPPVASPEEAQARMNTARSQGRYQFTKLVCQALGGMGEIAFQPLIDGLDDPDRGIRLGAAMALGYLGDERAIEPLIAALRVEPGMKNMPYNSGAMSGLRKFGARAVEPLVAALQDDNTDIRANAAMALAHPGSSRAVPPLIESLQDYNPKVRSHAAMALGSIGDTAAVEPLLALLEDSDPEPRAIASGSLGRFGDDRAVDPLLHLLQNDESSRVRMRTAQSLGHLGNMAAFEPLLHALRNDPDWMVRGSAAFALAGVDEARAVEPLLEALSLKDAPPPENEGETRRVTEHLLDDSCEPVENTREISDWDRGRKMYLQNVVNALSNMRESRVLEPLIEMLDDQDPEVRRVAARTLGNLQDQRAVEPLKKAAEDEDSKVSRNAVESLQRLGHPRGGKTLESVDEPAACARPDQRTRHRTARALLRRPGADEEIASMLESSDPEARAVALLALGHQGDPASLESITDFLRDEDGAVRLCAVEALSLLHDPRMRLLVPILGNRNEDPEVRAAAAKAIGELGPGDFPFILLMAMEENDAAIRREAAAALGHSRDRLSISQLITALDDVDGEVRAAAAESLGKQGHRRAVPSLLACIDDPEINVRTNAIGSLGMLEDERAVEQLLQLLRDGSQDSMYSAIPALGQIGDPRAVEPLLARLDDRIVRRLVLQALADIPDPAAIETVISSFDTGDESPPTWNPLAAQLAGLGEPALDPLISALENPSPGIRAGAALALGRMKDERAVEPLICALSADEIVEVRVLAAQSLGWIKDQRAIEPLTTVLDDPSPVVRKGAVEGLGIFEDDRVMAPLLGAMDDRSAEVRAAAVMQLAQLDGQNVVAPMLSALEDEDDTVRQKAAMALCYIQQDDPRIGEAFLAAVESRDLVVISGAYARLVEQGNLNHLPLLEEALTAHGFPEMAMDLLMCGNARLEQAVRTWVKAQQPQSVWLGNDYCILCPQWGRR